jgi:TusA-related sulfurtransferase
MNLQSPREKLIVETSDCRNLPCPAPVVAAGQTMSTLGGAAVEILADSGASREQNLLRASSVVRL